MSKQPPSSGRFGHPALDKILQTLAKAQADATKTRGKGAGRSAGAPEMQDVLGSGAHVAPAPTWDDMLYEALTRQRTEWMQRQGITGVAEHGTHRIAAQRQAMSPWVLK